ncbi:transporter, putative [Alloactinosynnema sp. L-07]|uniref:MFS transporter n=1 Tax=Alloactinosynnema sp. L-07 TaxID=1653480 RepID=UPI00065F09D9|nr:MFS transporter [Alloactinosynnema sp. L-07]CRK57297.1 transporter, putative [Alloactinosynnema sp. L-07]
MTRGLTAVFAAGGVSAFGTQMTMLALPWLVLETSGSATRAGLVFAVQVLPIALLGFLGGEVMQRHGAHRTMVVGDAARGPLVALVPILHGLDLLTLPVLLVIVALLGVFGVPYYAAQRVLAVDLIGADPKALTRANGIMEGTANVSAFAGPAAAGALIAAVGAEQVLWIDAASYAVSALLLQVVPKANRVARGKAGGPPGVLAGLRHLRADAFLGQTMVSTITFGFLLRVLAIALPLLAFARFDGDAALGGLLVASSGAGALAGSVLTYALSSRVEPRRLLTWSAVLLAAPLWLLVLPAPVPVLMAGVALSAAAVPLSNAPYFGILTARVPDDHRPKVLQSVITLSSVAGPLGFLSAGLLTDGLGVRATLLAVAALATLAAANILHALTRLEPASTQDMKIPITSKGR